MKNKKVKLKISHYNFFSKNSKGLSGVVTAMILIALTVSAVAIVWVGVKNLVTDKLEESSSCFDVGFSDKVKLNNDYTCFNSSDNSTQFSIDIEDIEIDELLISFVIEGNSKSFTITNEAKIIKDLVNYTNGNLVKLPEKNSGATYVAKKFNGKVNSIKISPKINGKQCGVSDSINAVDSCSSMAK